MRQLVAIYARVSSEQQTEAQTIQSQLAALREQVRKDGGSLNSELEFIDDGYSGSTLARPALERLRDLIAMDGVECLYVHSPDRLARKYAYQVLLLDEFKRSGVEVIFLNRQLGQSPEDELLLQVQGMVAEYERAKFIERSRRGKRHLAQNGVLSVFSCAPYGYRYISKQEGAGQARYEIDLEEAAVVRQVFEWVGQERLSIGEVTRRLTQAGTPTRRGKPVWDRSAVWIMLKNPAYKGEAAYGKTYSVPLEPKLRAFRGQPLVPKHNAREKDAPVEEWIKVRVPALVDEALFELVQVQLVENRKRARMSERGKHYLLQGLTVCKECGYGIHAKTCGGGNYVYYCCTGSQAYRFGGQAACSNKQL